MSETIVYNKPVEIEFKKHKASVRIDKLDFPTFMPDDSLNDCVVTLNSPLFRGKSRPCTISEAITIKNMYIDFWKRSVRKVVNQKP
jgi:hypothetical protein